MYSHTIKTRIRYSETDKMGYCYYGNYAQFFEIGRVETLRSLGTRYKDLEDKNILLPVVNLQVNYKKPVFYDEEIKIRTVIRQLPTAKIVFDYEITNEKDEITTTGETTLVFLNGENSRPIAAPKEILDALKPHF